MDAPKKWWWVIGVAVPVAVAAIAIVPHLLSKGAGGGGDTFYVAGTQFNGNVAFHNVTLVADQARQMTGKELPDSIVESLRQAMSLAQAKKFDQTIPLLESAAKAAPVPALFNNLGAAYLATGNVEKARGFFEQALAGSPNEKTAHFNLSQIEHAPSSPDPKSGGGTPQAELTTGRRQPTQWPGVVAEVTRLVVPGGMMVTLEVTFRNTGAKPAEISLNPHAAYLLDEKTGTRWDPSQYTHGYYGTTVNLTPSGSEVMWAKFLVGKQLPAEFTAVVPGVSRPFERLVLN